MTKKVRENGTSPGMGAVTHANGVTFRVWAPNAKKVFVTGTFNDWSYSAHPLVSEKNGYWFTDIQNAVLGDEYRYLIHGAREIVSRIDPYAREVTHSRGNGIIYDPDSFDWGQDEFNLATGNRLVVYEMHIGTFNVKERGKSGTFDSAREKLPYLRDLGINAIEIMPVAEFSGDFSWGYNPSHPFTVESCYGGPDGFKRFIKEAHQFGIAIIVDIVYNHFGPEDLDLWQFDGWNEKGKGGIYFYNDRRAHTPWGETRPDYGRSEVRQYLFDNARMWFEEFHVDGLRWDAVPYIRNIEGRDADPSGDLPEGWSLMQWINTEIQKQFPRSINIAEGMHNNLYVTRKTEEGGAGFDAQWDSEFVNPVRRAIIAADDSSRNLDDISRAIAYRYDSDAFQRVIFTESHDEVANGRARVPEEIWPGNVDNWFSKKRSTLGAAIVLTSPGIPMLFQGQEMLEDRWFHDKDPIDWSRIESEKGIVGLYRDLIGLRQNLSGVTRGLSGQNIDIYHVNQAEGLLVFHRFETVNPGDSVVIVLNMFNKNLDAYAVGFPRPGVWKTRLNSDSNHYDATFGNHPAPDVVAGTEGLHGQPCSGNISIGPYSVVIYSQDE